MRTITRPTLDIHRLLERYAAAMHACSPEDEDVGAHAYHVPGEGWRVSIVIADEEMTH